MLEHLERLRKDDFSLFVESQGKQGREVRFDNRVQVEIIKKFGKKFPAFLRTLDDFFKDSKVGIITLVANREDPVVRLTPESLRKPAKVVVNVINFSSSEPSEFAKRIEQLIYESNLKTVKPEQIEAKTTPETSEDNLEETKKKVSPQPLLLELDNGLKVYLPDINRLELTIDRDKRSPWIDLIRKDGKILSIWQWKRGFSEIVIGKKDYKIESNALLEERWEENTREEIRHPFKKEEAEGIIINLAEIKGNKELTEFLTPQS